MKYEKITFNENEVLEALEEFHDLYLQRPVDQNDGGMKSPHLFSTWLSLKKLNPKLVIESGVWKGLGTWVIEQAVPDADIISIEIDYSHLQYKSEKAHYLDKDMTSYNWEEIFKENKVDKEDVVVFLDDHQNFLNRLEFVHSLGVKHILYEDNYPSSQGDTYSPKKILACQDYIMDYAGRRSSHKFSYFDYDRFDQCVDIYQEFPPIYKLEKTRWGDSWDDPNYPTKDPLLSSEEKNRFPVFYEEADSYTWICYMGLSDNSKEEVTTNAP